MLSQASAPVQERQYFKEKPTPAEVRELAALLPGGARDLVSSKSRRFKELELDGKQLSEAEWVELLAREPGIWRRPVITDGKKVIVGFDRKAIEGLLAQA